MKNTEEQATNIVNIYFNKPDKTLEEVFQEYAEELDESEREKFFKTLKEIIN
ncbi:MAG: MarR family transcriptional regulator [Clostridium butyricum]|nr:MarR family transcriptional regulator [Clostridium butyricum]